MSNMNSFFLSLSVRNYYKPVDVGVICGGNELKERFLTCLSQVVLKRWFFWYKEKTHIFLHHLFSNLLAFTYFLQGFTQ